MITYNELISYAKPFFLSRWGDILADTERMLFYANTSIQDVYNSDNGTFTYVNETLTWIPDGTRMKFTTSFNIRKIQKVRWITESWWKTDLIPTLFFTDCKNHIQFSTWNNNVLTDSDFVKLEIIYIKEYKWATMEELQTTIQVPLRYTPAVIKFMYDWAAPINLMAWESISTDFYSHWVNRLNQLKDDDSVTDFPDINPY